MSLKSKRRIGVSKPRKVCQRFERSGRGPGGGCSTRNCHCANIVAAESKIEIKSAMRTPGTTPKRSIKIPPRIGEIIAGTRRMTDCTPMPIEWRLAASVSPTHQNVAGRGKQLQDKNKNITTITGSHSEI